MEAHAQDMDEEVNGVAIEVALRPAPVTIFDDETGIGGQNKIVRLARDELESAFFEQRNQGRDSGGADLFTGPANGIRRWVDHSLSSSGVG